MEDSMTRRKPVGDESRGVSKRSLHRLFAELNALFWNGTLPQYSVRRGFTPGAHGQCDRQRRRITIDPGKHASDEDFRQTLLHEMCHIRAPGHGKRFQAELGRLAAFGEAGAVKEREMYAHFSTDLRSEIEEQIAAFVWECAAPRLRSLSWRDARAVVAGRMEISPNALSASCPRAHEMFLKSLSARLSAESR